MPQFVLNKTTGLYLPTLLKKGTPMQVFSDDFCEVLRTPFLLSISTIMNKIFEANFSFHGELSHYGKSSISVFQQFFANI